MKKTYLLAGSLSLLGVVAGANIATANEPANFENLIAAEPQNLQVSEALPAPNTIADASSTITSVNQLLANEESMGQVTSVSQLSDVRPTDWAYQALASLVEKYGCIAGYPDGTFRGNRAATRYEMAAALNACLDVISDRFATKEDLATLQRLMDEFAAELATLRGRVDNLEARTAALEATQFSTTTKLTGTAVMSVQYGGRQSSNSILGSVRPGPDPANPGNNIPLGGGNFISLASGRPNPTVISAVLLNLNTSFTGTDLLQTTLSTGNGGRDAISTYGLGLQINSTLGAGNTFNNALGPLPYFSPSQYYWSNFGPNVELYRLAYTFKPTQDITITAGTRFYPSDIIDTNSWANSPTSDFGTYFFLNNPFIVPYAMNYLGGAGVAIQWNPNEGPFTVRALYLAAEPGRANSGIAPPSPGGGFAGDPFQASLELEYANTFGNGRNSYAVKLQGTYSKTYGIEAQAGGINFELNLGRLGIFGRAGVAGIPNGYFPNVSPLPFSIFGFPAAGMMAYNFMAGIGYKDLLVPGSVLAAAAGAPFINSAPSFAFINNANQVNIEAFYKFPISDNISITPIFTAIINPNNTNGGGVISGQPILQGVIRTTFTF
ncbi:iron uptake porin [Thermosynechococcus sp. PP45]|uniref:iron uptake porin n=1 Tax=unclassified Thermosynechococcus TaxID=2622553 RepID=UPI002673EF7C|nr:MULTISPECIES: iron uptake porin [unclassified Thermosynechococcus]WKT81199.1 iron uptake porin [Thermosynechococcus sp. PP45]WNC24810.1 iron uptake porin [Thermosynechococcus sp. PP551]WNC27387.1 iron uptake porin [Thermosynechococcus sp. PP555]